MKTPSRPLSVFSLLAAASILVAGALAPPVAAQTVAVEIHLVPGAAIDRPVTVRLQMFKVERDHLGVYKTPESAEQAYVTFSPGAEEGRAFRLNLEPGPEYELRVDALTPEGEPLSDVAYYFAGKGLADEDSARTVTSGPEGRLRLTQEFRLEPRSETKANFLQLLPRDESYDLWVILQAPTGIAGV